MNPYRAAIERLLQYEHKGIIVGGYALEFYANRYGVGIDTEHPTATRDLDMLGSSQDAQRLQELLSFTFDSKILVDLAIDMIRAWFCKLEAAKQETMIQETIKEIVKFAQSKDGKSALSKYGKNVMQAIPKGYF